LDDITIAVVRQKRAEALMKQLTVLVKPFRAERVLEAISELPIDSCIVREVKGFSRQKGYLDRYVGSEYAMAYLPKVQITVWIADERLDELAARIQEAARTGRMGDGKIFIVDVPFPVLEF
jgi:nitrogen regulatory protein PII